MTGTPPCPEAEYIWRARKTMPERHGQRCRYLASCGFDLVRVRFADGFETVVSRMFIRQARRPKADPPTET